ncbi:hypothetical protein FOMPIDRAFT_1054194 [Fomitopsis schrenkii]|uniref:Uncharacterized protein n=1 Tax=Fomitopsis schrenkii TaxID=2126942 RepID=S8FA23_FOMSC|nr:hypothetical protein FOMPIDRAFT_1054194 [Fomitopsis schrenkii]
MSLNETTVNAHRIRFARLIDVLLADAAIEPQYQPSRSREWLAWAHGARWHLRAVLESYCHVTAAEPGSLPSPFAYREIKEMLDYFDEVFKDRDLPEIERVGVPFPTLAWSEAAVLYKQLQPNTRLAVGLPMYTTVPTYLDDYRSLPTIVSEMSRLVDRLLEASRDKPSEPTDGPDDTMPALVPEPATNPAGPSLIDMLRASNTPTVSSRILRLLAALDHVSPVADTSMSRHASGGNE